MLPFVRREAITLGAVTLLYAALTGLLAWPVTAHPATTTVWMGSDSELFLWTLAWNSHAVVTSPLTIFDANIFHPLRNTLAYTENLIGSTLFAGPVIWLTGNYVLALNAVSLSSVILCGLGAFVLARRVGVSTTGAVLAGLVFAFSPPRFARIGQMHLTTVQWIPFALAAFHAYLDDGRKLYLRLAVGLFTLQAFTSGHAAVFLLFAFALLAAYRAALGEPIRPLRRLRDLGVTSLVLLMPAVYLVQRYRMAQDEIGLRRVLDPMWWSDASRYAASFVATPAHLPRAVLEPLLAPGLMDRAAAFLFPGFLPLLLALAAVLGRRYLRAGEWPAPDTAGGRAPRWRAAWQAWGARWRHDMVLFYALFTAVTVWFSAGAPIGPWPYLYDLPGFSLLRVPSRFTILSVLGLGVLAGFGFDAATRWLALRRTAPGAGAPARRGAVALPAVVIGALLVAEFAMIPLRAVPYQVEIPGVDRWLAARPKPFVVAELPARSERDHTAYMLHSTAHWQRTIDGYSGFRPVLHHQANRTLRGFPSPESLETLARLGVTYVVIHTERYRPGGWQIVESGLPKAGDWLRLEYSEGTGRVYSVHPPAGFQPRPVEGQ